LLPIPTTGTTKGFARRVSVSAPAKRRASSSGWPNWRTKTTGATPTIPNECGVGALSIPAMPEAKLLEPPNRYKMSYRFKLLIQSQLNPA
jgi:hypothetical protein